MGVGCTYAATLACSMGTCVRVGGDAHLGRGRGVGSSGAGAVDGERQPSHGLLVKLLEGLATLAALAAEPWATPARTAWP